MEDYCTSVFTSNITRAEHNHQNNLYDLFNIVPAKPLKLNDVQKHTCNYTPKTDKYYISKRKSRLKVKTVRDIRKSFEQDTYTHLFTDLEAQQNTLFKKIRFGSSEDDNTKNLAKKILKGDMPISRSTWQMLINLNPEHHVRPRQFVLWNGRFIQVTGSRGGGNKLICNYDLANKKLPSQNNKKTNFKQKALNNKKGLLRNSLVVKFKPGPLSKKQFLDQSYQKHHVGNVDLVDIPKCGLDVVPTYGTVLEPTIVHFLNNLRKEDGTISQKWAEFAVSALGKVEKSNAVQLSRDCVTFELCYNYNQNKLLMRRDNDDYFSTSKVIKPLIETAHGNTETIKLPVQLEIEEMIDKIISAVEINILQDKLFTEEQEFRQIAPEDSNSVDIATHVKDKTKKKFGELDRLDVTVIRLPETEEHNLKKSCHKTHCSLGCICASLEGTHNYRQHCGRIECMFDCTCDFSEYKHDLSYSSCTDVISGLNLNNLKLAKEEQKFHQTVIVTGKKRILLKGENRNWKSSKNYSDFYSNISLKNENQKKQDLSILAFKLDCNNIEPWCMVHKLYKCFCKGKFTETCVSVSNVVKEPAHKDTVSNLEFSETNSKDTNADSKLKECVQSRSKLEGANSVKRAKILENSNSESNKLRHTSRSSDETMNSGNISDFNDSDDETMKGTYETSSGSENMQTNTNGIITRHSSRVSNKVNSDKNKYKKTGPDSENGDYSDLVTDKGISSCSRTTAYEGRKYSNGYYKNTNYKILEMEKNDKRLQERLATLNKTTVTLNNSSEENNTVKRTVKTTNATNYYKNKNCEILEINKTTVTLNNSSEENNTVKRTVKTTNATNYNKNKNCEILEMDKNNKSLQERLAPLNKTTSTHNNSSEENTIVKPIVKTNNATETNLLELLCDVNKMPESNNSDDEMISGTKRRRLSSETKLVAWLESNYKMFKQRNDQGLFKNSLEPPKLGKVALHSWEFILNRYRERKNLFLVSQQKPFRIFMAVNTKSIFFENCININDIRFAHLHKYPQTVRNLLINARNLKDNFCILRGLSCCWELIGSVTKVNESNQQGGEHEDSPEIIAGSYHKDTFILNKQNDTSDVMNTSLVENSEQTVKNHSDAEKELKSATATPEDAGSSKWFVMTIENDFSEIRFFRKGFFVKSDTIINAIHVARLSGKTVRLSSKKCIEQSEIPQFGIYAIPNNNEYCVFVGPYEMEDTLGIETIKTILDVRKLKRTRGFWITTNKVDNMKVVENPLSFVPITNAHNNNAIPLETHFSAIDDISKDQQGKSDTQESLVTDKTDESKECSPTKKEMKIVKPIKIRKTNGFYHLASDGVLKKISGPYTQKISNSCLNSGNYTKNTFEQNIVSSNAGSNFIPESQEEDSVSEAIPQIKISAVYSQNATVVNTEKHERGMFILKPEEINRKVFQSKLVSETCTTANGSNIHYDGRATDVNLIESDADSLSNTSTECGTLKDDIYILSDDDDTINNESINSCNIWKNVWIECTNISNLGWIAGIKNTDNLLSFKFPGCEYSEFYTEEEAFTKINSELLKKIDTSRNLNPQWKVTESSDELQGQEMDPEHLYPDYILTREGLLHTSDLIKSNKDNLKTYSKKQLKDKAPCSPCEIGKVDFLDKQEETRQIEED